MVQLLIHFHSLRGAKMLLAQAADGEDACASSPKSHTAHTPQKGLGEETEPAGS